MQVSVGTKNNVGKALSLRHGYSLTKVNNAAYIVFRPIEEALEQHHFFVSAFYKGTTIITKHCLELISLNHPEIRILIGNGYINNNFEKLNLKESYQDTHSYL